MDGSGGDMRSDARVPRPAAPVPRETEPGLIDLLLTLNRNPLESWMRQHYEAPVLAGESLLGRYAVVSDPTALRRILIERPDLYPKDELQKRILKPALGNGLLTSDGEAWRTQRRLFAPVFSPRAIARFLPAMVAEADALADRLAAMREGRPVDIGEALAQTMLLMLARTIFAGGLGRSPAEFRHWATRYFETQGRVDPLDLAGAPHWLPRIGSLMSRPALAFFPKVVAAVVAERRRALARNPEAAPDDLVGALLGTGDGDGLDDAEIAANVITFIGAGFETPSNALTWALYVLPLDPAWRAEVEAEVDAFHGSGGWPAGDLTALVKLTAHMEEAMRLYPPVAIITRRAAEDDELAGVRIGKGATVILAPWIIHRHSLLWQRPDAFDPHRFLPDRRGNIDRLAYIPFGAGPRVCIGATFAMQQMTATLAALIHRVRLEVAPGCRVWPVHRVTLRPETALMMTVHRRHTPLSAAARTRTA